MGWSSSIGWNALQGGNRQALWTPALLPGLVAWWDNDPATMTFNSGNVASWTDKKSGIAVFQSTAASQPAYSSTARNGLPGVTFDGTNDFLYQTTGGLPLSTNDSTIIVAAYSASNAGYPTAYGVNSASAGRMIGSDATSIFYYNVSSQPRSSLNFSSLDRIISFRNSGSSGIFNIDGNADETSSITTNTLSGNIYMGCYLGGSAGFFPGTIQSEIITFGALSTSNRQKAEGYLSWHLGKAGANLPSGHPYKSRAPYTSDP